MSAYVYLRVFMFYRLSVRVCLSVCLAVCVFVVSLSMVFINQKIFADPSGIVCDKHHDKRIVNLSHAFDPHIPLSFIYVLSSSSSFSVLFLIFLLFSLHFPAAFSSSVTKS